MGARSITVLCVAFLSSACGDSSSSRTESTKAKPEFGEPGLVRMEAAGGLRYEMAIALSGIAIAEVLEPVSTSVHKAVGSCPDVLASLEEDQVVSVRFSVASGDVKRADDSSGTSDECLSRALASGGLSTKETFEAWVQLRRPPGQP